MTTGLFVAPSASPDLCILPGTGDQTDNPPPPHLVIRPQTTPKHSHSIPPFNINAPPPTQPPKAGCGVEVRGLSVLTPQQVTQLKEAAEEKEKSYAALCWLPRPLSEADVALLEQMRDLVVQQRTPVRVGVGCRVVEWGGVGWSGVEGGWWV